MNEKQAFDTIVSHASPHITLSYVLDDAGNLLAHFNLHPQIDGDHYLTLDKVSSGNAEILLTTDDLRSFARTLLEWADATDVVIDKYHNEKQSN